MKDGRARRPGCLGWGVKIGLWLLVLVILLLPVGSIYQYLAAQRDRQAYPPPGKLVDVGGFRLHLVCTGSGNPTVVMEAGLGDASFTWDLVQTAIARETRVCAYDRPGLGWSDFVDQIMLRDEMARNLHTLLHNAGEPGPYLLVGHSAGGIYVRSFANQYPQEVAGLVLVDSAHESQLLRYDQASQTGSGGGGGGSGTLDSLLRLCEIVAPTGILRLTGATGLSLSDSPISPEAKARATAGMNRDTYCRTIGNEMNSTDIDMSQTRGPEPLGDIPLFVLTASSGFGPSEETPTGGMRRGERVWRQMQSDLAALSTRSKQVIAERSSHYIQWDQPDLVISAILEIAAMSR